MNLYILHKCPTQNTWQVSKGHQVKLTITSHKTSLSLATAFRRLGIGYGRILCETHSYLQIIINLLEKYNLKIILLQTSKLKKILFCNLKSLLRK